MDINKVSPKDYITAKHLLSLSSTESDDIYTLVKKSKEIKLRKKAGEKFSSLNGKNIVSLAKKTYVTNRLAFEMAVQNLGGNAYSVSLTGAEIEEILKDVDTFRSLPTLGVSAVVVNTAIADDAELIKNITSVPIINTIACNNIATLLTVWEKKNKLSDLKMAIVGKYGKIHDSLVSGAVKCGMTVNIVSANNRPDKEFLEACKLYGDVNCFCNLQEGIKGVDVIYVLKDADGMLIDRDNVCYAAEDVTIIASNPVARDISVTSEILDGEQAAVAEQTENLLYVEQTVLSMLLKNK